MTRLRDAVVVGGGPAGLCFAAAAAARGLDVTVLERREGAVDKACGEGILPAGRRVLEALGVVRLLDPAAWSPLRELRWRDAGGPRGAPAAEARLRLPGEGGLGVRRTALSAALRARAAALGAELRGSAEVVGHRRERDRVVAQLPGGEEVAGRLLVAADGLASPIRRREGLELPARGPARFGLRCHLAVEGWPEAVEVHLGGGVEAYLTPSGRGRVGVAFLFERGAGGSFQALLARFPELAERLAGAQPASEPRGAGPLARRARARVADRLVLLGDAAGYLDAVSGEGLSLAFACAADLAALLPAALARGAGVAALAPYEAAWRRRYRPYAGWTRLLLALSRRPALRRAVLRGVAACPGPFERLAAAVVG